MTLAEVHAKNSNCPMCQRSIPQTLSDAIFLSQFTLREINKRDMWVCRKHTGCKEHTHMLTRLWLTSMRMHQDPNTEE